MEITEKRMKIEVLWTPVMGMEDRKDAIMRTSRKYLVDMQINISKGEFTSR